MKLKAEALQKKNRIHRNIYHCFLIFYALSLPFYLQFGNYIIALLLANWLLEGNFVEKLKNLSANSAALTLIGFFLMFCIGITYSDNINEALGDVERKLALLILPVIVLSQKPISNRLYYRILISFAISCIIATSVALLIAFLKYNVTKDISLFYYHALAMNIGMHAIYLSCYLCFTAFILIEYMRLKHIRLLSLVGVAFVLLLFYTLALIVLLSSKTLLICLPLLTSIYFLVNYKKSKNLKYGIVIILGFNVLIVTSIFLNPYTRSRFENAINSDLDVLQQKSFRYDTEFTGLTLRLLQWKFTIEILNDENAWLLGVGTGDSQDKLGIAYRKYNMYLGDGKHDNGYLKYNTHSLFFEVLLKLGLVGLFYLLFIFSMILYISIKKKNWLFLTWALIFFFFSLTEATLQVNKGTVFFAFFYCVLQHKVNVTSTLSDINFLYFKEKKFLAQKKSHTK